MAEHEARRGRSLTAAGLLLLTGLGVGALVALVVVPQAVPASIAAPTAAAVVSVSHESFADQRPVKVTFGSAGSPALVAPMAGRITASGCREGRDLRSGTAPFDVAGEPLIALATTVPLWRDLSSGTRGEDVRAVQKELRRLGYDVDVDARWGGQSAAAWKLLETRSGATRPDGVVEQARVLWLPARELAAAACPAVLGDEVAVGGTLVTLAATANEVKLSDAPDDLVAGDRVLVIGAARIPLGSDLALDDAARQAALATREAQRALASGDPGVEPAVAGVLALAAPIEATAVPASSILATAGGSCVFDPSGAAHAVEPLASSAGQTWVVGEGTLPESVLFDPPQGSAC